MCLTCGCGDEDNVRVSRVGADGRSQQHEHSHHRVGHDHAEHDHVHPVDTAGGTETLELGEQILAKNDHLAAHNRSWIADRGITALNLMSSPGSGKTSLLERTIAELSGTREICVIEGDQETLVDAQRITAAGARAVQVNTGAGCHLDAPMVQQAMESLAPTDGALLFIENVGNLVCPALFDIGEQAKVVIISVTEGDDKPLKYPHMFAAADLVIVNKTDLLPYVDFDLDRLEKQARSLRPGVDILAMSVRSGENVGAWYRWLATLQPTR